MPRQLEVTGAAEIIERFAEAAAQLVTSGLNATGRIRSHKIAEALEDGAKVQLIVDLDPLRVEAFLLFRDRRVQVFWTGPK